MKLNFWPAFAYSCMCDWNLDRVQHNLHWIVFLLIPDRSCNLGMNLFLPLVRVVMGVREVVQDANPKIHQKRKILEMLDKTVRGVNCGTTLKNGESVCWGTCREVTWVPSTSKLTKSTWDCRFYLVLEKALSTFQLQHVFRVKMKVVKEVLFSLLQHPMRTTAREVLRQLNLR